MATGVDMSDYTIEDLKDKYVETGTPEAEVFLDECIKSGMEIYSYESMRKPRYIECCDSGNGYKLYSCRHRSNLDKKSNPFVIKQNGHYKTTLCL